MAQVMVAKQLTPEQEAARQKRREAWEALQAARKPSLVERVAELENEVKKLKAH